MVCRCTQRRVSLQRTLCSLIALTLSAANRGGGYAWSSNDANDLGKQINETLGSAYHYPARAANISLRWMVERASNAGLIFSFRSLYGDDIGGQKHPVFKTRPDLEIAPHKVYLHLTHPNRRGQYEAFQKVAAERDPTRREAEEARCVKWLVKKAARIDKLSPTELKATSDYDCVLLDLATQLHDSFDLKYRVSDQADLYSRALTDCFLAPLL